MPPVIEVDIRFRDKNRSWRKTDGSAVADYDLRDLIKGSFARALPGLLVTHADCLGLDPAMPASIVEVTRRAYDFGDINVANLSLVVQFGHEPPSETTCREIYDHLYGIIVEWFSGAGYEEPKGFKLKLRWATTYCHGLDDSATGES